MKKFSFVFIILIGGCFTPINNNDLRPQPVSTNEFSNYRPPSWWTNSATSTNSATTKTKE